MHQIKGCMLKDVASDEHSMYAGSNKPIRKLYVVCILCMLGVINCLLLSDWLCSI